ncbi:MAG: M64 family metallopeptidase [Granulosicoccus sp.]
MKVFDSQKRGLRGWAIAFACLLLAACDSGDSVPGPSLLDETDPQQSTPLVGTPVLSGARAQLLFTVDEDSLLSGRFYDPVEPSQVSVAIQALPEHGLLTLQLGGQAFNYEPEPDYWGPDSFTYSTFKGEIVEVMLTVNPQNDLPVLSPNLPRVAEQGRLFTVSLDASDADGDELVFSASGLPDWLVINTDSGELSGIPTQTDVGFFTGITLRVTDSTGLFDELLDVVFEVIDINDSPTLNTSQFPTELLGRESITANVFPDDADGDEVTLSVESNTFLDALVVDGSITLTAADVNDVTLVNLVLQATDQLGGVTREVVPITIFPLTASGLGITLSGSEEGRGVHLVILGDGYREDQQNLFREHVEDVIEMFEADKGIAGHMGAFNIHMISTVSTDSGADDNDQVDSRDTAFDSIYNCRSVPRLICANTLAMFEASLLEYPAVDQLVLLVNDNRYGGSGNSGGSVAITSAYSPQIALHEMGHSLADLADEYVDSLILETNGLPAFEEGRYPNVSGFSDPAKVPWTHWIDDDETYPQLFNEEGVGVFEGGLYRERGVYRPTFNSRMRSFDAPFGEVNSEQWILRLYTLTEGIRGFSPIAETLELAAGEPQEFVVSPLFDDSIQNVVWELNGEKLDPGGDPHSLVISLPAGNHELSMTVSDISGRIRIAPPHAGIFNWTWELTVQ